MLVKRIALQHVYPSIFNRFPVIQPESRKVRHFSTFFAHFGLLGYAPRTIAVNGSKENSMLVKRLAAYPSSTISDIAIYRWRVIDFQQSREVNERLYNILLSPGYAGTIAVNVTRSERGMLVKCLVAYIHLSSTYLRYSKLLVENCDIFIPYLCLAAHQGVTPSEFREDLDIHKTRMNALSCAEESMTICSAVLIQYQRVTDGQTDGRTSSLRRGSA